MLWSVAEITHERERQENVFQELQHAIDYLDHAPAGFLSIDPGGSIVYLNATLAAWLDYDLAQVGSGGLHLADIAPRNMVSVMTGFTGEPGSVRTETFDLDLRRRNGQFQPVRLYHRIAFGQDGRMGASRTLVLDRSPGVETDEGQRAAEVRFARFFNNTPIAIATVNRSGRIVQANAPFTKLFGGLAQAREGGDGPAIVSAFRSGEGAMIETALKAAAESRGDIQPLELHAAGTGEKSVRVWVTPVSDVDSEDENVILYALDTTDFRRVEEQLAQSQKMNAVGQLAGGVAHDFNNVLQAIIGYSDLLLTNHRPTDPSFQDIMQIKQNANRAASLVRQLLAFSRRQTLRPEVLNLNDRLYDLSMLLKRLLGERVELNLNHGRELWFVKADVNQFEQVIVNMAVNARDAMPEGGKLAIRTANVPATDAARLNVSGMPPADYVLVEVSDTGSGMSAEVLEKIFEPFFTTKEVGKGTGLGLSTVFGIIKQSGGFIDVDSRVGRGTLFRIYLPRHIPERGRGSRGGEGRCHPQARGRHDRAGDHPARRGRGSGSRGQRPRPVGARLHGAGGGLRRRGHGGDRGEGRVGGPRGFRRGDAGDGRADPAARTAQGLPRPEGDLRVRLCRGRLQEEPAGRGGIQLPAQALQPAAAGGNREAGHWEVSPLKPLMLRIFRCAASSRAGCPHRLAEERKTNLRKRTKRVHTLSRRIPDAAVEIHKHPVP